MFWVVVAILVVGYLIVQALNRRTASVPPKLLLIGQRIEMLKKHDNQLQTYLGKANKEELEEYEKLRYHKHDKYDWKIWDKDHEQVLRKNYDDFCRMVELNARICQRLASNEQGLVDQLADWGTYLEQLRDSHLEGIGTDLYINANLDMPYDEVAASERAGVIREVLGRMMDRARTAGINDRLPRG